MNGSPRETNTFSAPEAVLETLTPLGPSGPGWFWGTVFSLPVFAILGLLVFVAVTSPTAMTAGERFNLSAMMTMIAIYGVFVIANGVWLARRNGSHLLGATFVMGIVGSILCSVLQDLAGWLSLPPEISDGFWTLALFGEAVGTGLGLGLYALIQGLLIRWSLKRHARRTQA